MANVIKRNLTFLVAMFLCSFVFFLSTQTSRAQEVLEDGTVVDNTAQQNTDTEAAETTTPTEVTTDEAVTADEAMEASQTPTDVYAFVAQKADSYTKMARKAVQIFGIDNKVELSGAQIVYIETNLTLLANSPELNLGQSVSITKATVNEWVEKAKQLTDAQKAAWQVYADRVDFNTNSVGEAQ